MTKKALVQIVYEDENGRRIQLDANGVRNLYGELAMLFEGNARAIHMPGAPILVERNPIAPEVTWTGPNNARWQSDSGFIVTCTTEDIEPSGTTRE